MPTRLVLGYCVLLALVSQWALAAREVTLFEAYQLALKNDTQLQIARYQRDAIEAREDQADSLLYPTFRVFSQYSKNQVEYEGSSIENRRYDGRRYGAALSQRVFDWAALSQRKSASARSDAANLTVEDETQLLAVRVVETYFSVLAARDQARSLGDELAALQEQAEQSSAMAARQLVSVTEQLEVNARRDLIETRHIDAENSVALAEESFFALIGSRDFLPESLPQVFEPLVVDQSLDDLLASVMAASPKIQSLEAQQAAAKATIDQVWGSVLPKVELVATQQYSDVGFDNLTSPPRDTSYIGLNVNWTLVEGGAARARAREAWANYYSAAEQLKQVQQGVERELRSAWLEVAASEKRIKSANRSFESASQSYDAAKRARELGVGSNTDVLLSRSAVTRAELNRTSAILDNVLAWVRVHYISGSIDTAAIELVQRRL